MELNQKLVEKRKEAQLGGGNTQKASLPLENELNYYSMKIPFKN
jgi:hypothetical protein